MSSFAYLMIGYAFGGLVGGISTYIAIRIHVRQHHGVKI